MPKVKPIKYYTSEGVARILSPYDSKKIASQLIAELMQKEKRSTAEMTLITKLLKEIRDNIEFIDYKKQVSTVMKELKKKSM